MFNLSSRPEHILLSFPDGLQFAYLRTNMTKPLAVLLENKALEFETFASKDHIEQTISKASRVQDAVILVNINIYGPPEEAVNLGEFLSSNSLWLQRPQFLTKAYTYDNPHHAKFPEIDLELAVEQQVDKQVPETESATKEHRLRAMVNEVHSGLHRAKELEMMQGSQNTRTDLLEFVFTLEGYDLPWTAILLQC
jgi:hypothetical protein